MKTMAPPGNTPSHTRGQTKVEQSQLEARGIHVVRGEVTRLVVVDDDRLTGVDATDGTGTAGVWAAGNVVDAPALN